MITKTPMTRSTQQKPWYRFFDGNRKYDYKSLYNAVTWAQRKAPDSTSQEIRVLRVCKRGRALELEQVAKVLYNRSQRAKTIEDGTILPATYPGITTVWNDLEVYTDYKEKEQWVSTTNGKAT